ncbi:MAG TPA: glycogen-binding domain-containing protein [Planctomycetota bacterium]|nr:glycogen-binding domain-containing protein [Planctomycetota bacterium]
MPSVKLSRSSASQTRQVPVIVRVGEGRKVVLTGDFTSWSAEGVPMKPLSGGRYGANLQLQPGTYQFRILVDGNWANDLDSGSRVSNPFGTENSVLEVS